MNDWITDNPPLLPPGKWGKKVRVTTDAGTILTVSYSYVNGQLVWNHESWVSNEKIIGWKEI
jgi:hypothetical protein